MHYGRHVTLRVLVLLITIGLAGCQQQDEPDIGRTDEGELVLGRSEVVERVTRAVSPGERMLVLEGFTGAVALEGTGEDVARLVFEKRARGADDAAAREVLDDIDLEEEGNAGQYVFTMRSDEPARSAVDVQGTVPRDVGLRIDFVSGPVTLAGIEGPIAVEHQNGNVQMAGAANSVRVNIRNGNIELGLRALPPGADVELTTSNGNLTLALPPDASAQIEAVTQTGAVRTQGLEFSSRRLDPQGAGARFEAQLGDGNATIELRTENGTIVLRGERAPAPDTIRTAPADTAAPDTMPSDTIPPDTADTTVQDDTITVPPDTTGA